MGGLARMCRMYGGMKFKDKDGKEVIWLWDYKKEIPRLESEMTKREIKEKEKWLKIDQQLKKTTMSEKITIKKVEFIKISNENYYQIDIWFHNQDKGGRIFLSEDEFKKLFKNEY